MPHTMFKPHFPACIDALHMRDQLGERLLPVLADFRAKNTPERVWACIARSSDIEDGFYQVTFRELVRAVDFVSWQIHNTSGRSISFETLAYIGISDLRYTIVTFAAIKCGYKASEFHLLAETDQDIINSVSQTLLLSTGNSEEDNFDLLEATRCTRILCSKDFTARSHQLRSRTSKLEVYQVSEFQAMIHSSPAPYHYEKTYLEAKDDPVVVCHTSGSTGSPKPVTLTHWYFAAYDSRQNLTKPKDRMAVDYTMFHTYNGGYLYNTFHPAHISGFNAQAMVPLFYNCTALLGPTQRPPSGVIACEILRKMHIKFMYSAPSTLEDIVHEPDGLELVSHLESIVFTGGPLAISAGNALSKVTSLAQFVGSTEIGIIPTLLPKARQDWAYVEFNPSYGCDLQSRSACEVGFNDLHELVLHPRPGIDSMQPAPYRIPPAWRTRDLYTQHPSEKSLWRFCARSDDVIVLRNGEKISPSTMETVVQSHPSIKGALVIGQGQVQPVLMLEPRRLVSTRDHDAFIEHVWPSVRRANARCPTHARIFPSNILLSNAKKPFLRTGKNTIQRWRTIAAYATEIDAICQPESIDCPESIVHGSRLASPITQESLRECLRGLFMSINGQRISDDEDMFVCGLDSLQSTELANRLRAVVQPFPRSGQRPITARLFYFCPTFNLIVRHLIEQYFSQKPRFVNDAYLVKRRPDPQLHRKEWELRRQVAMEQLIAQYTNTLPYSTPRSKSTSSSLAPAILVAGSTGNLGNFLLEELLRDRDCPKIYCFDRSETAYNRHRQAFGHRGISDAGLFKRLDEVIFLHVKFGEPRFGLTGEVFNELLRNVTLIIHNACLRSFIDWSLQSERHVHIVFHSSVASAGAWTLLHSDGTHVPERPLDDYRVAGHTGYAESKFVAEKILQVAHQRSGVSASILRLGQIVGCTRYAEGTWNVSEALPAMLQASKVLRIIPENLPSCVDWLPVDYMARIVMDIIRTDSSSKGLVTYNIVNPRVADWKGLIPVFQETLASPPPTIVPLRDWVHIITEADMNQNLKHLIDPALKLLDYYADLANMADLPQRSYQMDHSKAASKTLSHVAPIDRDFLKGWLSQWKSS